ncbi:MAG: carboxymuconolactone decarboxylase family protein [Thalassobaculum sp.]
MTWIKTVAYEDAAGRLKTLYDRVKGPGDNVDNIMMAHSLRPHSMEGHMHLYKYVLHHASNKVPKHFLETIGVQVSLLNGCSYCVEHHFQGLRRLLADDDRANEIRGALEAGDPAPAFDAKHCAALRYSELLTRDPATLTADAVEEMRSAGWDDGEILEINQVTAYFAYANRTVLGLGVSTEGDILGLSPGDSDDPENWNHG